MPPPHLHTAYGIVFRSDRTIPGLPRAPADANGDEVRVHLGRMPAWLPAEAAAAVPWGPAALNLEPGGALRVDSLRGGAWLRLAYADGTCFLLDHAGRELWAAWEGSDEDAASYLVGPVLGLLLRLRGVLALHASVVAAHGRAAALAGPAGAGKSTAAAAFARAGLPVLADDVAALEEHAGGFHVLPAFPQLRLWPESAEALYGHADALPRLAPGWEKRALDLSGGPFHAAPLPLAAVYLLAPREAGCVPRVETVAPAAALVELVAHTFAGTLLDAPRRRREFEALSRLVRAVPVRRLVADDAPGGLDALVAAVAADLRALPGSAA
jgi:hypothetical protein